MANIKCKFSPVILMTCLLLNACAGTQTLIDAPRVNLTSLKLVSVSLERQTFNLGFAVQNTNPFPLPVRAVEYDVFLDDERFASGETQGSFTVPAHGSDDFTISVDLDFLNSAAHLATLLQNGVPDAANYQLQGSFTVDVPFAKPLPFSSTGTIRLQRGQAASAAQ